MNEFLLLLLQMLIEALGPDKTSCSSFSGGEDEGSGAAVGSCPVPLARQLADPSCGVMGALQREGCWVRPFRGCLSSDRLFHVLTTNFPLSHEFFQDLQEPTLNSKGSSLYVSKRRFTILSEFLS